LDPQPILLQELIVDNDTATVATISDASAMKDLLWSTFTLSNPLQSRVEYTFVLANGTAGDLDYTSHKRSCNRTCRLLLQERYRYQQQDNIDEADENFSVLLEQLLLQELL
jgi:hypothetical protein